MIYWAVEFQNYMGVWKLAHDTNGNYALFADREFAQAFIDARDEAYLRLVELTGSVLP
jgi:hypothetical protein